MRGRSSLYFYSLIVCTALTPLLALLPALPGTLSPFGSAALALLFALLLARSETSARMADRPGEGAQTATNSGSPAAFGDRAALESRPAGAGVPDAIVSASPASRPDLPGRPLIGNAGADMDAHTEAPLQGPSREACMREAALFQLCQTALPALFGSVVSYLNRTSEPMSETLVRIKTSIAAFQEKVQASKTEYEERGHSSDIMEGIHQLRAHITEVTQGASRSFAEVAGEIDGLSDQMKGILEIVANISDVAERIHILSINASIESARAGLHGRGFKVIADEVQRLSKETQGFVQSIGVSVNGTKHAFATLHGTMEKNRREVDRYVSDDQSTYTRISETLDNQVGGVVKLYQAVLSFIESLDLDMSAFAPLGQLHAIITQEIENLSRVGEDVVQGGLALTRCSNAPELEDEALVREASERIRARLTTSRELDALASSLEAAGFRGLSDMKRNNTDIEFF